MRVAFTGTGYISRIHAVAAQHTGMDLAAVVNHSRDSMTRFAEEFGVPAQFDTVEDLLADDKPDILVISTPNYLHAPQTIAALRAGVHVMVEKPMAMNADEAASMCAAAETSGARLMVAHCWRFDEDVIWLKQHANQLGDIIRTKGMGVHTRWGPSGWFTDRRYAGGGAMADMGIHAIDTARFLLGDPAPKSVYAKIGTHYREDRDNYDVDDTGVLIIEWQTGATSYIESGWWQPHADGPEAAAQVYGTKGFGAIFPTRLELTQPGSRDPQVIESGLPFPRAEHSPQALYDRQFRYFVDCIENNVTPVPGGSEGMTNMRIVDAAYRSSETGEVVKLS